MDEKKLSENVEMPMVPLERIRVFTSKFDGCKDELDVSLMMVLAGLFPNVWDNIKEFGNDMYTQGYLQGCKEGKKNED